MCVLGDLFAQNTLSVLVHSAADSSAISYAEVVVATNETFSNQSIVKAGTCNENGQIKFELSAGKYFIKSTEVSHSTENAVVVIPNQTSVSIYLKPTSNNLDQVVVTVQAKAQTTQKAVERITVITAKDLENRSVFNLKQALEQQLNVQIANDNSTGSAVSLMGVSGQNVKILIDGVPVIGRLDGNIDLSQINLNDVERIEVIEGPVSTAYGSNALAGVINIITKKKSPTAGEVLLTNYNESIGQYNLGITGGKQLKKVNVRAEAGRNMFRGWNATDEGRYDSWKPKEQFFGRFQVSTGNQKNQFLIKSEGFRELLINKGRANAPYFETAFDEHFYTTRLDEKVQYDRIIDSNKNLNAFVSYNLYNRQRVKYYRDLVTLESRQVPSTDGQDTTGFVALQSRGSYNFLTKTKKWNTQLGYDFIFQNGTGARIEEGVKSITDMAVYALSEMMVGSHFSIKPGIRLAYNSVYKSPIAPTFSARYEVKKYVYRFSYGRGFRAPDIKELYLNFVDVNHNVIGNENLKAEKSHNFQTSVTGFHKIKKGVIRPSLSVFYNDIFDKITLANISGTEYTYVNLDQFKSLGGQVNLAVATNKTRVNIGFSATNVVSINNAETNQKTDFSYIETQASINQDWRKIKFTLSGKYTGPKSIFSLTDNQITESKISGFGLVDFQMNRHFMNKRLDLSVGVKNLMNVTNLQSTVVSNGVHTQNTGLSMGTGRSYFMRLALKLSK